MSNFGKGIDKKIFWPATIVTLALGVVFFAFPEQSNTMLNQIHDFTTHQLGWFFLLAVMGLLFLCCYFAFSRLGNVVLGAPGEKPAYSTFTWLGMILNSGTGGSLLYLGAVEWIWMSDAPPFGVAPRSAEALSWASAFGMWNWGFSAWAFYVACAVPIGYFFFVKRKSNMKMSEYCRPLLGKRSDGLAGHAINFVYLFALLGGVFTSLALGTPPVSSGIAYLLGWEETNVVIAGPVDLYPPGGPDLRAAARGGQTQRLERAGLHPAAGPAGGAGPHLVHLQPLPELSGADDPELHLHGHLYRPHQQQRIPSGLDHLLHVLVGRVRPALRPVHCQDLQGPNHPADGSGRHGRGQPGLLAVLHGTALLRH